ncbi:MAG: hypothetical protein HQL44_10385 [Alphaproteobacteria bacterium]|nr:hypothetical protein [Alphaproteobacteria bacterium]
MEYSSSETQREIIERIACARCGDCLFFRGVTDEYGRCCNQPPTSGGSIMSRIGETDNLWKLVNVPTVTPNHFCGSFQRNESQKSADNTLTDRLELAMRKREIRNLN